MTLGSRIREYRISKGLTQKELADVTSVSYQTVSKWENDTNEPDIGTLKTLAKLFGVTLDELTGDGDIVTISNENNVEKSNSILEKEALGICYDCGQMIYDENKLHAGRVKGCNGEEEVTLCDRCYEKRYGINTPTKNADINQNISSNTDVVNKTSLVSNSGSVSTISSQSKSLQRKDKKRLTWSIIIGVLCFIAALIICIVERNNLNVAAIIFIPIIVAYCLIAEIYCVFSDSWISDLFLEIASWSIKMPGVIFSFSIEGLKFLIAMKIFFWLLGIAISIGVIILAAIVTTVFSVFAFIPYLFINR